MVAPVRASRGSQEITTELRGFYRLRGRRSLWRRAGVGRESDAGGERGRGRGEAPRASGRRARRPRGPTGRDGGGDGREHRGGFSGGPTRLSRGDGGGSERASGRAAEEGERDGEAYRRWRRGGGEFYRFGAGGADISGAAVTEGPDHHSPSARRFRRTPLLPPGKRVWLLFSSSPFMLKERLPCPADEKVSALH